MKMLEYLNCLQPKGQFLNYRLFLNDYPVSALTIPWQDTIGADNKTGDASGELVEWFEVPGW